jgi:cyanobactin maturation PatA/PatG family protease
LWEIFGEGKIKGSFSIQAEVPSMAATTASITNVSEFPGISELWAETKGDSGVCVAVLDGPVDQSHPCFAGANLTKLQTLVADVASSGQMSGHGTHITSAIFGQHGSPVQGIAPGCRGLIVPVFSDNRSGPLSQLDLARAINQAVEQGAHIINISGGQLSQSGEADPMLENAVRFCNDNGVLIVAAAGNDGCKCLHVPAALPAVLAVGAMNSQGLPFDFSNWGDAYQTQGILAPGENILGAETGGGVITRSGTSFATPIVSGIIALLLSIQLLQGEKPNPHAIRDAILKSALPCHQKEVADCSRFLVGIINIPGAYNLIAKGGKKAVYDEITGEKNIQPSEAIDPITNPTKAIETIPSDPARDIRIAELSQVPSAVQAAAHTTSESAINESPIGVEIAAYTTSESTAQENHISDNIMTIQSNNVGSSVSPSGVVSSGDCGCNSGAKSLVYALGVIGYDFSTEARRDSFKQLMPFVDINTNLRPPPTATEGQVTVPPNPYDARQMKEYLRENLSEAKSLIWTLNLELTPIYAIDPQGPFAHTVYQELVDFLEGQVQVENSEEYVERVSIPAVMTGKSVRLFSGQVVPVIEPINTRGMYSWKINSLIEATIHAIEIFNRRNENPPLSEDQRKEVEDSIHNFLHRIYYDLRNLGQTSQERALNYAATNVFQFADGLVSVLSNKKRQSEPNATAQAVTMQMESINVERSPFCRMDSDCWDVKIKFFDPENDRRARRVLRFTVDVSDIMPVTLGQVRVWDVAN